MLQGYGEQRALLSAEIRESFTEVVALKWSTHLPLETPRREF